MVTQAPKRTAVLAAVAFVLSCVGLTIFVWTQFSGTIPFAPEGYRVQAVFPETGQLVSGADVRIAGVDVGKVTSVNPEGTNSLVAMSLYKQFAPIPADTHAILRLKTLLGEAYIELSTGNGSGPKLPDGGTIPRQQVEPTQDLDQVLDSFNPATQRALQEFLNGTYSALDGQGQNLNDAIGNLDPTVSDLSALVGELNEQQGNIQRVVNGLGTVFTTLGDRSSDVQTLVTAGNQVLSATAARDAQLEATVNGLPPFLAQLRATLSTLNVTLGIARPTLNAIRGAAPLLRPAFSELITLSGPALSLLHQAPTLLDITTNALPYIARFTVSFNNALTPILQAAQQVVPMINYIQLYPDDIRAAFANLPAVLGAEAPATNGISHYIRVALTLNNETLFGQEERPSTNRHNPYISPDELNNLVNGGLESSDCNNTGNTELQSLLSSGNVPCRVQPAYPWPSNAASNGPSYYPHLTQAPP